MEDTTQPQNQNSAPEINSPVESISEETTTELQFNPLERARGRAG